MAFVGRFTRLVALFTSIFEFYVIFMPACVEVMHGVYKMSQVVYLENIAEIKPGKVIGQRTEKISMSFLHSYFYFVE